MTVEEARAAFPVLERLAYLNAGTFGPLARATLDAINEQGRLELEGGRGGAAYFEGLQALREGARTKVAAQIGVDPDALAYRTVAELPGADQKSIRDAGGVAVAELMPLDGSA